MPKDSFVCSMNMRYGNLIMCTGYMQVVHSRLKHKCVLFVIGLSFAACELRRLLRLSLSLSFLKVNLKYFLIMCNDAAAAASLSDWLANWLVHLHLHLRLHLRLQLQLHPRRRQPQNSHIACAIQCNVTRSCERVAH